MRALLACWVAGILLSGAVAAAPARADTVTDRLVDLKQALLAVRAVKASNAEHDAGPELTPVKTALRRWVEAQLPPPSKPGQIEGTIESPTADGLKDLARQMNDALDKAHLICGGSDPGSPTCKGADKYFPSERGYVGGVQLGLLDYGRYLLVVTGVGVQCGEDQSAYLYRADGSASWKLVFATEQDDYRKGVYEVQNFTEIAVSGRTSENDPDTPPLVATLGYGPWCSSTWSALYTRLWRMSDATMTPRPLVERSDSMWWGNDDFGAARLSNSDLLVQYTAESMDAGVHNRKHLLHYRIGPGDKVERIDPLALRPMDFVDDWLISDWRDAAQWIEGGSGKTAFEAAHRQGAADFDDTGKRCRQDRSLWQVSLVDDRYFQVRWTAPYVFRLVAVSHHPFAGCDQQDPAADDEGASLFPDTQWHPTD